MSNNRLTNTYNNKMFEISTSSIYCKPNRKIVQHSFYYRYSFLQNTIAAPVVVAVTAAPVLTALCKTHQAQINEIRKSAKARAWNLELAPNKCKRNSTDCHCAQITRDSYNIHTYTHFE